jgi:serine protease Do
LVSDVVAKLKTSGGVERGWLGVKIQNVTDESAKSLALDQAKGAQISEIVADSPGGAGGLRVEDVIVEVNGAPIGNSRDLARKIAEFAPGTSIMVKIWRNKGPVLLPAKLGRFQDSPPSAAAAPSPGTAPSPAPAGEPDAVEVSYWNSVKDSKSIEELNSYLARYPSGKFAELARIRIKALNKAAP